MARSQRGVWICLRKRSLTCIIMKTERIEMDERAEMARQKHLLSSVIADGPSLPLEKPALTPGPPSCPAVTSGTVPSEHNNPRGEDPESIVVWGALDHDLNLDIPGFPRSDIVADIKWNRNKNKIARIKKDMPLHNETDKYDMFTNGTLKIKTLMRNDSGLYEVEVYDSNGVNLLSKKFDLKIQEMLSGPEINWICTNRTVSCKVENGSNPKLELFLNMTRVKQDHGKLITYTWNTRWNKTFKCVASNHVDSKVSIEIAVCPDEGLDWYLIIGICVGGAVFLLFVALLIFYISRRKKQSRRRDAQQQLLTKTPAFGFESLRSESPTAWISSNLESLARRGGFCLLIVSSPEQLACCGVHRRCARYCYADPDFCQENSSENSSLILADEELEIKAQRAILEERGRKPQQTPVSTPANPGMSQTPPVPGHRSQPPAHRPRALGPRVQPQQKRLPPTPGTQVHQQKGPPLPKPRVQTKPPCDAEENS
ncbi:hypothetical protein E5288_WYG007106 [Bos mutus]|uniref:Immunoglobulin V-set domain-containing protein n=1 Tax=Bos mutus TaxID=72004 RepID=A0A6B0QRD6_9CETA|nr:hypothetical protein [Bos mutus]